MAGLSAAAALTAGAPAAAMSDTDLSSAAVPVPQTRITIDLIDVNTYDDQIDFRRPIGSCSAGSGGKCTITRVSSISTTVEVAFEVSEGSIATKLGFSMSRTNSTSASCSSPKMRAGQAYRAYNRGTTKFYNIKKTVSDGIHPPSVSVSGRLMAFQPHSYPDIYCRVE